MFSLSVWILAALVCLVAGCTAWLKREAVLQKQPAEPILIDLKPWEYPAPSPDLKFDLATTEPPRFRAFRYSYKRHVIDVRKLDKDSWVIASDRRHTPSSKVANASNKLDKDWPEYHRLKIARLADVGNKVMQTLPVARMAAHELCQDLCEFLSRRYPALYKIQRSDHDRLGWYGYGSITEIAMPQLNTVYDLATEDPLRIAGLIQPADVNILVKGSDGHYVLAAMMIAIGGGQRVKDKLGKKLADLHLDGHVPHYAQQLQRPLDHFLSKLKVENPIQRNTTAISIHDEWHWPELTMGPEDDFDPKIGGPGLNTPSYGKWRPPGPITDVSQLWFRQERQTLRRLPKSGAIVWMVHTYVESLVDVINELGVPGRLASLIRSWDDQMAKHKSRHLYEDVLLPRLGDLHKKQVESGECADGELPSNFPWEDLSMVSIRPVKKECLDRPIPNSKSTVDLLYEDRRGVTKKSRL